VGPITRTVADAATALSALSGTSFSVTPGGFSGKRVAAVGTLPASVTAALAGLGATTVTKTAGTVSAPSIIARSFEKDLGAYLGGVSGGAGSLQGIVNYNAANPVEGLKYQQRDLEASLSPDLGALEADTAAGRTQSAAVLDALLSDTDVIAAPAGSALVNVADRAGYPVLTVPAAFGTGGSGRNPIGVVFIGAKDGDAALLNAGYAFEQATNVRLAPSWTNPSMFRCVPGSTFFSPHHCHPGDALSPTAGGPTETAVAGEVGGTVPATLSLALSAPSATFGAFTPGVAKDYTATLAATVVSTAGDAALAVSDPGHLTNGTFSLPSPLEVAFSEAAWTGPVSNEPVAVTFKQHIGAADALRTGSYSKTLTFTLSTTTP
jgi:hypothetical protein